MKRTKYFSLLASIALLSACNSDEPGTTPTPDGSGTGTDGTPSTITFRLDGLASGGIVQSQTKAGEGPIASQAENDIAVIDILVFAHANFSSGKTTPVAATATPLTEAEINTNRNWFLQEWHYAYDLKNFPNAATDFPRVAPSTDPAQRSYFFRQFTLGGSGTFRTATITPVKGIKHDDPKDERNLRFLIVANGQCWSINNGNMFIDDGDDAYYSLASVLSNTNVKFTETANRVSCPMLMLAEPTTAVNMYQATTGQAVTQTLGATLRRGTTRFDIINKAYGAGLRLTEVTVKGAAKQLNPKLRPEKSWSAPENAGAFFSPYTVTLPTAVNGGTDEWTVSANGRSASLPSAFYATATKENATEDEAIKLNIKGTYNDLPVEKEITVAIGNGTNYTLDPNTRYILNINYGNTDLETSIIVVDWEDDYINPALDDKYQEQAKVTFLALTEENKEQYDITGTSLNGDNFGVKKTTSGKPIMFYLTTVNHYAATLFNDPAVGNRPLAIEIQSTTGEDRDIWLRQKGEITEVTTQAEKDKGGPYKYVVNFEMVPDYNDNSYPDLQVKVYNPSFPQNYKYVRVYKVKY